MWYIRIITHLPTIDPNFQREIFCGRLPSLHFPLLHIRGQLASQEMDRNQLGVLATTAVHHTIHPNKQLS